MNSRACRIQEEVVNSLQGWEPFFGGWNRKIRQIIHVRIATPLSSLSKTTVTGLDSSLPSVCRSSARDYLGNGRMDCSALLQTLEVEKIFGP